LHHVSQPPFSPHVPRQLALPLFQSHLALGPYHLSPPPAHPSRSHEEPSHTCKPSRLTTQCTIRAPGCNVEQKTTVKSQDSRTSSLPSIRSAIRLHLSHPASGVRGGHGWGSSRPGRFAILPTEWSTSTYPAPVVGGDCGRSHARRNPGAMQAKRKGLGNGPKRAPRPISVGTWLLRPRHFAELGRSGGETMKLLCNDNRRLRLLVSRVSVKIKLETQVWSW
jgi:hypothetical protein